VEISDGADKFREHATDEGWSEEFAMASGKVKEISPGVVTEDQDSSTEFDAPGFEVHERRVPHCLHEFKLALEAHLDAVLGGTPSGAMLADLNGYQGPAFMCGGLLGAGTAIFVV
jgi:fructose-1-phosphate kinase PfkB-like protein